MFNTTFKNISVISWRSVLLEEETRVPGENHRSALSYWQPLPHNVVSSNMKQQTDQCIEFNNNRLCYHRNSYSYMYTKTSDVSLQVLGLWCLMPLSTIFQFYRGSQFYWWRKPEYQRKPLTCRKSLTNFITTVIPYQHSFNIFIYYTLLFYFPYLSLLAQPVNITLHGPGLDCLVFEASVHKIFFWWQTGPYTAIWPSVPWTICYIYIN